VVVDAQKCETKTDVVEPTFPAEVAAPVVVVTNGNGLVLLHKGMLMLVNVEVHWCPGRVYADLKPTQTNNLHISLKSIQNAGVGFVTKRVFDTLENRCPVVKVCAQIVSARQSRAQEVFYKSAFVGCLSPLKQRTSTINDHVHMLRRLLLQVFADMYAVGSGPNMTLLGTNRVTNGIPPPI
jgi:hypothetical protein